jgi:hypothetical protein
MQTNSLQFVVANAPELDFDLVQEVWLGEQLLATLRNIDGKWRVIFFPDNHHCELPWIYLTEIHRVFAHFIREQESRI